MTACPSPQFLRQIGSGRTGDTSDSSLDAHIDACRDCQAVLDAFAAEDSATANPGAPPLPGVGDLPQIRGFEIECALGRGGMGVVYLARQQNPDRPVALKFLPSGPLAAPGDRERWLKEANAAARVRHPHIVQLHQVDEADGWLYLVLEYVPGGSLKERLTGPLPPKVAATLLLPIAEALEELHRAGVWHLDLKPANILIDAASETPLDRASPKLADFGIARLRDEADLTGSSHGAVRGTPSYMAPEQVAGRLKALGPATDIHATGALLYELLTGRPPFLAESDAETMHRIQTENPLPPRRLNPRVPRDLETICLRCLAKEPQRRYSSAMALAGDLRRWLDGRPIQARPVSPYEHATRWCRRQPVITALVAALLLTLFGGFLGLLALLRRSEVQRSNSEANYRVASQSLDAILPVFYDFAHVYKSKSHAYDYHDDQQWNAMARARSQEIELSKRYPLDIRGLRRLALIDSCLAALCVHNGKQAEGRSLLEESIDSFEACLALGPDDVEIRQRLLAFTGEMLMLAHASEDLHLFERWHARAIATLERSTKFAHTVHIDNIYLIIRCDRRYADFLMLHNQSDRARKELENDLDLVRSVPVEETALPAFVLTEALALAALGRWSGEFTLLRSSIHSQPGTIDSNLESGLAELTARRIGWLPSIVKPPWLIPEELPTEAWTDRIITSMKSDAARLHVNDTRIPAIGWLMREHFAGILSQHRKVGKLGDAHRIADQLVALADRLTKSYPDQASAYMLLSETYVHKAKNAYKDDDKPAIERWEREALGAAIHAAALESEDDEAHSLVKDRRARLKKLASK